MSESAVEKKPQEEKTEPVPKGNKDAFDALLKASVPTLEDSPEEETSDGELS